MASRETRKKIKIPLREEPEVCGGLLAQRLREKGFAPPPEAAPENTQETPKKSPVNTPEPLDIVLARAAKIVLQRETAGRGGKTVTIVSLREAPPVDLEALAKALRKGLGCGSHIEGDRIVLHGDIVDRASGWLEQKGAKRIVRGN